MARLRKAGHHVEQLPKGTPDSIVWRYAQEHALLLLTRNGADFVALAAAERQHHGALFVHGERDATKDMTSGEVAAAVDRVGGLHGRVLTGQIVTLNGGGGQVRAEVRPP